MNNNTKAFYVVSNMIAEHENFIEESQAFIFANKGNQKFKDEVKELKVKVQEHREKLKPLYKIRNAFYGSI